MEPFADQSSRKPGFDMAGVFLGLWLFPLGLLVCRSGFIPRIPGILLVRKHCLVDSGSGNLPRE
jgi:hypothetical protein